MDAKEAFVLWRGLGIDYEGGVLDHPARVAIHFVHRLGALVTALTLLAVGVYAWRSSSARARIAGACVVAALVTQVIIGPLMVMRGMPLGLAIAHNAMAALLLLSVVRLNAVAPRKADVIPAKAGTQVQSPAFPQESFP
jgi:cytochrome c oxidase assembly protein subunit 15